MKQIWLGLAALTVTTSAGLAHRQDGEHRRQASATLRPRTAKPGDSRMRKILFAAIATLAVTFGDLATATAARIGDGSNMPSMPTTTPGYSVGTG